MDHIDSNEQQPNDEIAPVEGVEETSPELTTEDSQPTDAADESDLESDVPEVEPYTPEQKKVNFVEERKTTSASDKPASFYESLHITREAYKTFSAVIENNEALMELLSRREVAAAEKVNALYRELADTEGSLWFRTLMDSMNFANIDNTGAQALTREDSEWRQSLDYEGKLIRAGQPKQKFNPSASPQEKINFLTKAAGVGIPFDVPLIHSGIWLRFKTPTLSALTSLQHQLAQVKVNLGSVTKGLAFSNVSQTLISVVNDFALQHVVESNVHYTTPTDLKEKIVQLDLPLILWGLAVTLYPTGFPYKHPCVADPTRCRHVTEEILNLNYLHWTDSMSLTAAQKKMLAGRFDRKLTSEDLTNYRNEHIRGNNRIVWFGEELGLELKVPTILEFEEAGRAWIDGIIDMSQGAFNEPPHGSARDAYITKLGVSTTARQYTHWVNAIYRKDEDGEPVLFDDSKEVIEPILESVLSSDEFIEDFIEKIKTFIDDSMIAMIAIPSFNCPKCDSPAAEQFNQRFPHLVPLDVVMTFFTLVSPKLK